MLFHFHKGGYEARSHAVSRALRKLHDPRVSMTEVSEEYPCLPDGTRFLQYHTPELHIYYSAGVIEKACALGLKAIVADSVHDLQPGATNKTGQLYVIHGVAGNGVDGPLLYAITTRLLEVLLEARCDGLYGCSSEVRAALPRVKRKQSDGKKLLKKNILQRRLVEREMNR
ncbi:hypothetical protein V3C99_004209, partial [Haemonchus contortus]